MPAIAFLNDIERTRLYMLGSLNHHINYLGCERRAVLLSNHICGGDVAPSGVCLRA